MTEIVPFLIGATVGACFGALVMALMAANAYERGRGDERSTTAYDRELARRGLR